MPDLGKYADAVLSSYALSLLLIFALVGWAVVRSRKARAALEETEQRIKNRG
ncbi:heme exporter protein CcmD [Donghicola sp. C2-DW-16]|uniref:Heme exporter protein D n=1 Tax=Donghicola mangrovi TaxID=2729614 RepID=A0A850Q1C1_9RHOB|nr:heme exporter protein CcmD [Donghicola mangrovi]NVO22784.1 heme exporter protein CcmD [Donghicola mangrovi]NVO27730.1 heme exporter protein CcmD [Donghicola mangrovi]